MAERDQVFRTPISIQEQLARGVAHNDVVPEESSGFHLSDQRTGDAEVRHGFCSISGNHVYRHHVEPRVKIYVPEEGLFFVPLKNIVVVRWTHRTLDVLCESRRDDYRNADGDQQLSNPRTSSHFFSHDVKSSSTNARLALSGVRRLPLVSVGPCPFGFIFGVCERALRAVWAGAILDVPLAFGPHPELVAVPHV